METWRIANWQLHYEHHYDGEDSGHAMSWVPVMTKQGSGFLELMNDEEGIAHFGVWVLLLEVAARAPVRGALVRKKKADIVAHTLITLQWQTRAPINVLERAVDRLLGIGWVEYVGLEKALKDAERGPRVTPATSGFTFRTRSGHWDLTADRYAELREAHPSIDIDAELKRAAMWLEDNPTRRKTAGGMARFLGTWMTRNKSQQGLGFTLE